MKQVTIFSEYILSFLGKFKGVGSSVYIGLILTFLGLFLSWRSYTANNKRVALFARTTKLVEGLSNIYSGLEIFFRGEKQDNVSVTKLVFWNRGKQPIRREDLVVKEPLTVQAKERVTILDAKLLYPENDNANEVILNVNQEHSTQKFEITFDFLDKDEGFVLQVIHTGGESNDIPFSGKIIGLGSFPISEGFLSKIFIAPTTPKDKKVGLILLSLLLIFSSYGLYTTSSIIEFILWGIFVTYSLPCFFRHLAVRFPKFFESYEK